jgi:RimJ/RimL family protein N-acetyltransferase
MSGEPAAEPHVVAAGRLVRLRDKRIEDAERDYAWRADPELAAYDAARPVSISFRSFTASLAEELRYPANHRRTFAIEDRETGRHIGNVMYYGYDARKSEAELGITIGEREYWSRGFGADAVRTMVRYLFEELGLRRVFLHTLTWNYRAQASFKHAGFRAIDQVHRGGYDFIEMDITPDTFPAEDTPEA